MKEPIGPAVVVHLQLNDVFIFVPLALLVSLHWSVLAVLSLFLFYFFVFPHSVYKVGIQMAVAD